MQPLVVVPQAFYTPDITAWISHLVNWGATDFHSLKTSDQDRLLSLGLLGDMNLALGIAGCTSLAHWLQNPTVENLLAFAKNVRWYAVEDLSYLFDMMINEEIQSRIGGAA